MPPLSRIQLRQEIAKLNRLDPDRASYSAIELTYSRITNGFKTVVGMAGGGELFHRVRRTEGYKPSLKTELHAPPAKSVTGFQRCNPPGVPMFYAASQRLGAIIESRAEVGETIYLSQWIGQKQIPVNRIFDSDENKTVPGVDSATIYGPNDDILLAYFDTQFTKRVHSKFSSDYKFTSAIAQQLTTNFPPNQKHDIREDGCVALKYPSVHALEGWHNTALHADFSEKRLDLLYVMEALITEINGYDISIEILDTAVDFSFGEIKWTGNTNMVPLLSKNKGVIFISDGEKWNLKMYDGPITQGYIKLLLVD